VGGGAVGGIGEILVAVGGTRAVGEAPGLLVVVTVGEFVGVADEVAVAVAVKVAVAVGVGVGGTRLAARISLHALVAPEAVLPWSE
jgi:hypothetical protein